MKRNFLYTLLIIFIVANGSPLLAQSWARLDSGFTSNSVTSFAAIDSNLFAGTTDQGVFLSTNNGASWTRIDSGLTTLNVRVLFTDRGNLFAGTNDGVFLSTNIGASWTAVNAGMTHPDVRAFAVSPNGTGGTNLFVAPSYQGIYLSTNNGASWTVTNSGLIDDYIYSLAVSPNWTGGTNLFAGTSGGGGYSVGVLLSTDNGSSWINATARLNTSYYVKSLVVSPNGIGGTNLFAGTIWGNVLLSPNNGTSWVLIGQLGTTISSLVVSGSNLYAGTNDLSGGGAGVFLSPDNGVSWTQINAGLTSLTINSLFIGGSHIFAGTNGAGIWRLPLMSVLSQVPELSSPPNGALHQILSQIRTGQFSVPLQWNYPANVYTARVQAGTDSTFVSGLMLDSTIVRGIALNSNSITLYNVVPKKTYYWRVKVDLTDSTSTDWSDTWKFTAGSAVISGLVFGDDNADSIHEAGETGLANWRVDIFGKIQESVYTDSNGMYSIGGLDSGTYTITQQQLQYPWRQTFPSFASYIVTIGVNDSVTGINFGDVLPWNSIEGTVYLDVNENGMKDGFEPGLMDWTVTLFSENSIVATQTDSLGHYKFPRVDPGTNVVDLTVQPPFEQETPRYQQGYTYDVQTYSDQYTGFDFGVHKIPVRVKIPLTIYDNTLVNRRDIWFGIRPGATYGIWGVDPKATNVDFSEGEFEIPPPTPGLFDARFQDPHSDITLFGAGSWTDMRDFVSTTQRDTFLVSFAPGYYFNGNYPMTIQWSRQDIHAAFPTVDPVLIDPKRNRIDMSNGLSDTAKVIISDSTISSMLIVTADPHITFSRRWNMVSLPQNIFDDDVHHLFPTANSHAFLYVPGSGYTIQDTLHTGRAYWVKYSSAVDSLKTNPKARLLDSMTIQPRWNMIGALSSPIAVNNIVTIPPGIFSSRFFGCDNGYSVADTLLPTKGYWIKASQSAKIYLNASGTLSKTVTQNDILAASNVLLFRDHAGSAEKLYCTTVQAGDTNDMYEAPPLPPDGEFDVRFSSNRILEKIGEKQTGTFPVVIQGAESPLTLSWEGKTNSVKASIIIDGKETILNGKINVQIVNPESHVSLKLSGMPAVPLVFSLQQNYPNPFNPSTTIRYNVPVTSHVTVTIYNILGQPVATLVNGMQDAGYQTIEWNGGNFASGVYYYRMRATSKAHDVFSQTRKMVLIR